jgi:hypothetical protein
MSKPTWKIIRESDDPRALRLSVGGVSDNHGYIVYRGDTKACLDLLRAAVTELEKHYEEQGE